MDRWVVYAKSGNPSSDIAKAWLKNNGIPFESTSVFRLTREEIDRLANLVPGGVRELIYPDVFSFSMINPQRNFERQYIEKMNSGQLTEEEIRDLLAEVPSLCISPIITNYKTVIVGYDLESMVSAFRFVKVKDVTMA
ncbi:hypothetical protein [Peribacillus kribbensis]|uniref:hypothetical protein n=1 Tax=Peribacillus kribbensis TaxID=356658 RepID=UPI0004111418|nr:hypothetical protein [Peribacillus kribbensis]